MIFQTLAERWLRWGCSASPIMAEWMGRRLIRERRFPEAEAMLARAVATFPRHVGIGEQFAVVAQSDGRFADGAARWEVMCDLRPRLALAWGRLAECRRALREISEARAAIVKALARAPDKPWIMHEAALIFDLADEPEQSVRLWARLVARADVTAEMRQGYVEALARLERLDEADDALRRGFACHPEHRNLLAASGMVAMRRDDWDSAFDIWSRYAAICPNDWIGQFNRARAASMLQMQRAEQRGAGAPLAAPVAVEHVEDDAIRCLLLDFESVGCDCEFGTVQRRYGAEPLGLLRWNDVTFPTLAAALKARFERMGDPDVTELDVGPIKEIYVRDRRWGLGMHTFMFEREVSFETLLPKMCRRVAYLRDKFVADLGAAEKVLVFKSATLSFADLSTLHGLLRAYGPVRLLHVRPAASAGMSSWPEGDAGSVAVVAPDLYVGYVARMGNLNDVAFEDWIAVCRGTMALDASRRAPAIAGVRDGAVASN